MPQKNQHPYIVIFDLGGVLVDWSPYYLLRDYFASDGEVAEFLKRIDHDRWNHRHDQGRSLKEGVNELIEKFPEYREALSAYHDRWPAMLKGTFTGTENLLYKMNDHGVELYALTNWCHETFHFAKERFQFLDCFDDIVVSGVEGVAKPDASIYEILLDRNHLQASQCLFIDDKLENIETGRSLGLRCVHYQNTEQLRSELLEAGFDFLAETRS